MRSLVGWGGRQRAGRGSASDQRRTVAVGGRRAGADRVRSAGAGRGLGRRRRADRAQGPAAPGRAGPADRRPRPGRPGRPPGRRPVGRAAAGRRGRGATFVARCAARWNPTGRRAPRPGCWSPRAPGTRCAPAPTPSTPGGSRRRSPPRRGCRRRGAGAAGRGAGVVARPRLRRVRRPRTGPAPSAPAWPSCGCTRSSARAGCALALGPAGEARARPGRARRRAPLAGGGLAPARARAVPQRAAGRRARRAAPRPRACWPTQLGVDPGPPLRRLETDILRQAAPRPPPRPRTAAAEVWAQAAAAYDRDGRRRRRGPGWSRPSACCAASPSPAAAGCGRRGRTGSRPIAAAEEFGDPELTARVIGAYDVPAIWTRADDPEQAARIVAAASAPWPLCATLPARRRRGPACWPRSRWSRAATARRRGPQAARARPSRSPAAWTTPRCWRSRSTACSCSPSSAPASRPPRRDRRRAGRARHPARPGHLRGARAPHPDAGPQRARRLRGGRRHAAAADRLAERHERPLVGVFTAWYRALRLAAPAGTAQRPRPPTATPPHGWTARHARHGARTAAARAAVPAAGHGPAPARRRTCDWGPTRPGPGRGAAGARPPAPRPPRRCASSRSRRATC